MVWIANSLARALTGHVAPRAVGDEIELPLPLTEDGLLGINIEARLVYHHRLVQVADQEVILVGVALELAIGHASKTWRYTLVHLVGSC